jgi:hypothetical protein
MRADREPAPARRRTPEQEAALAEMRRRYRRQRWTVIAILFLIATVGFIVQVLLGT